MYAFPRCGAAPLSDAYRTLMTRHAIDGVVLVDGGTDILMFGDESGLGTPEEDMASLAAVRAVVTGSETAVPAVVACIGFGIDAYHGVDHT